MSNTENTYSLFFAREYPPLDNLALSDAAMSALAQKFWVGEVTRDSLDDSGPPGTDYEQFIGAKAIAFEMCADNVDLLRQGLARGLNTLAEHGLIVGRRSGPFWSTFDGAQHVSMRVMIAAGRAGEVDAVLGSGGR